MGCSYEYILIVIRAFRGGIAETPIVGSLLNQPLLEDRIAPIAILVVFGWVLIEILLHFARVAQEFFAVQAFQSAADIGTQGVQVNEMNKIPANSRAGSRAALFAQHIEPQNLHEAIAGMAALDAGTLDNSYSFIRVYVWILPVIGFIGTAWGMSHAIGGFGDALKGNLDIQSMTARLSQLVIPGLANAFSTTILALIGSIIAHFCASVIQSAEHTILNDLDKACVRLLAKATTGANFAPVIVALQQAVDRLGQIARQINIGPASVELSAAAKSLQSAAHEMQQAATAPYNVKVTRG
jgi:biopolymer transport protein ExbB/TolQ